MVDEKDNAPADTGMMLVLLGLDKDGKAHASRFIPADSEQAVRAARLMKFHAVNIGEGELYKVATELPVGKIFVTGKGLVPFVKRELYDKLAVLIGTDAEVHDAPPAQTNLTVPTPAGGVGSKPEEGDQAADLWAAIRIGSTVLARSADSEEGWYEAVVTSISANGDELTLRWRDYAWEPVCKRRRRAVAILPRAAA